MSKRLGRTSFDWLHIEVVSTHISQGLSIRRKFWIAAGLGRGTDLDGGGSNEIVIPQLAVGREYQVPRIWRPVIRRDVIALDLVFVTVVWNLFDRRR